MFEQQSGLPYEEAVLRAWAAFDKTAREKQWPAILYAMCDETRLSSACSAARYSATAVR